MVLIWFGEFFSPKKIWWLQYCYWSGNICQFYSLFLSCTWTRSCIRGFWFASYNRNDTCTPWVTTLFLVPIVLLHFSASLLTVHKKKKKTALNCTWKSVHIMRDAKYTLPEWALKGRGTRFVHIHLSMHALRSQLVFLKERHETLLISRVVCYSIASALNLNTFLKREKPLRVHLKQNI